MVVRRGDYTELCATKVVIRDIPALLCPTCGVSYFPLDVLQRLSQIVDRAQDLAAAEGLREVRWAYSAGAAAEIAAEPGPDDGLSPTARALIVRERFLAEATERAGRETPSAFN
jgi:hypothetical protein